MLHPNRCDRDSFRASFALSLLSVACVTIPAFGQAPARAGGRAAAAPAPPAIRVTETDDAVTIDTDALSATVRKKGYVSGIAEKSFVDKKTGAKDIGFGL